MRVDKFLWAVRLFKTRRLAAEACATNKVLVNEEPCKPGKEVKTGTLISIRKPPIWRSYKVTDFPKSRVGAKLVPDYILETTSKEDLELLESVQLANKKNRIEGRKGRPTKKDRRDLDRFK